MILTTMDIALAVIFAIPVYTVARAFQANLTEAKRSGIPYIIAPMLFRDLWWLITQDFLLPVLHQLPSSWTESWLSVVVMRQVWHHGYAPFARVGSDTFMVVSPSGNVIWTCDPDVINQIHLRRAEFTKSVEMLGILNVFGPTVTGTEGPEAHTYRKITAPSFNDASHNQVWSYSLAQMTTVLERWRARMASTSNGILISTDVARMTLHVLSFCSYGRQMDWEDEEGRQGVVPAGHTMSYTEAISSMLAQLPVIFFTPPGVLQSSPRRVHKQAKASFDEAKKYMEELRDDKQAELRQVVDRKNPNLLDTLVHSSPYEGRNPNSLATDTDAQISPEAVIGNIFIFILAGHETNANTLNFALTLLACHPKIQRQVQKDLDRILGDRDPETWTYEKDFPALLDGYVGALFNETVRLFTVLPFFGKETGSVPTTLHVNGQKCVLAPKTSIMVNTSATHRNPKYWGNAPPTDAKFGEAAPFPVTSFSLKKWINGLSPTPGAFIPFGEGARACMGTRFAKAGFAAEVSRILKTTSVELAVEGDDRDSWLRAKGAAEKEASKGVDFTLALKMTTGVPLRFVPRGSERWADM